MKIVVIGGTGLIGSKVVEKLKQKGHEAIAAAPNTGVNTITGEGLAEALEGAAVVVDVANSPSFEDKAAMNFFQTSGRNLTAAEAKAGVGHHVALSVVGTERLQDSGYFRAKLAQEENIKSSPVPYTLIRATQFFEFIRGIAQSATVGDEVRLSHSLFQPMAAEDVATAVADAALAAPTNGTSEIAGPATFHIDEIVATTLAQGCCGPERALLRHQAQRPVPRSRPGRAARFHHARLVAHPRSAAAGQACRLRGWASGPETPEKDRISIPVRRAARLPKLRRAHDRCWGIFWLQQSEIAARACPHHTKGSATLLRRKTADAFVAQDAHARGSTFTPTLCQFHHCESVRDRMALAAWAG
jgi:uncharacterized protein YbjT (DUF2867 family)